MPARPPPPPDVARPGADPVTRLLLAEAGDPGPDGRPAEPVPLGLTLVVEDQDAALTRALRAGSVETGQDRLRVWADDLREARAAHAAGAAVVAPEAAAAPAPELVLGRLPGSLDALDDLAERLADRVSPAARVLLGGRVKHMTRAQNDVLARHFTEVSASLGQQKCRVLRATGPRPSGSPRWPRERVLDDPVLGPPLTLVSRGQVFAGGRLDAGTRLLLQTLARRGPTSGRALDLGCGSGVIALWLARRGHRVGAGDVSAAAVESARRSAVAAGLDVAVHQADGLEGVPAGGVDLLVSNPPFHRGAAKDSTPTLELIDAAGAALAPDGELWLVWNAHLPYLRRLRQRVGPTEVVTRDRRYVVSRSRRR